MFWTDWGSPGKVERAYMDGTGRITIADTNLVWPNDITIDYEVCSTFNIQVHTSFLLFAFCASYCAYNCELENSLI